MPSLLKRLAEWLFFPSPCKRLKRAYEKYGSEIIEYSGGSHKCRLLVRTRSGRLIRVECRTKGIVVSCFSYNVNEPDDMDLFKT